ncbi:hypothetical protein IQ268_08580 [Oculatella sp. LEGE 06141]|uniref:hypothetical protein n=1 Tax=Oculatella sp. LEGE 06141 TaxID=1828648 RepID=UPI00187EF1E3|nr:hypothetical protein [Oculatella sp. LEGE 06141]MBE9178613.1 hypothetical protein [Oculatella sp. LEGE 06141]
MLTPGRPNIIQVIGRALGFSRPTTITGTQRPRRNATATIHHRNFDLEIQEVVVRDYLLARQLVEMRTWCPEVATTLSILRDDILGSENGDSLGLTISDTLEDDETPVDPDVKAICTDLFNRLDVLDIATLGQIIDRALGDGDAFLSIGIDRDGTRKGQLGISRTLALPTWTMFRLEEDNGLLLGYEQRVRLQGEPLHYFYPPQIVHFRHRRQTLYGQSIWRQSGDDWQKLKEGTADMATAARELGINPNVHEMPEGVEGDYKDAYQQDHEARLEDGVITNYYTLAGGDIRKLANYNPNLSALADNVLFRRTRLIMPAQIPLWRYAGFKIDGAKDISGQPAKAYARYINSLRSLVLTPGIKQILNTELILRLGYEAFLERGKYQLSYPVLLTDPMAAAAQAAPDEESESEEESTPSNGATNGRKPKASSRRKPARY